MSKKGLLLIVSGPSGVGKGTVCGEYIKRHPECFLSVSATTRPMREGEKDGVNYFFLTEEEFRKKIDENGFLEHAVFCGNYYGTPSENVMKMLNDGKDVILEIEVQGAMQVRSHYPEGVFIFVLPPSLEVLEERLRGRQTESEEVIKERLARAKAEFKFTEKYNYALVNDTIDNSVALLESVVNAEKASMARNYDTIKAEYTD